MAPSDGPHEESFGLVRPYVYTRGRTSAGHDLPLETLVSASKRGQQAERFGTSEHRALCRLCSTTYSVAEIAARLHLPLGVVRVLVADLAEVGLITIHAETLVSSDRPSMELMERVLRGLRNI